MERAILLPSRGGDEIGDARVNAKHGRVVEGHYWHLLVIREREPPASRLARQGGTAVQRFAGECLPMIGCQFHWKQYGLAWLQGRQAQPVIEAAVFRWLEEGHIGVGLCHRLAENWRAPFLPRWRARGSGLLGFSPQSY